MRITSILLCFFFLFDISSAQSAADTGAVNRVVERYRSTQEVMDLTAQGSLMAPDRVWVSQHAGRRRTNNAENMRIQQAYADWERKIAPGIRQFVEDRER